MCAVYMDTLHILSFIITQVEESYMQINPQMSLKLGTQIIISVHVY
jgi:hypothetical protein